jgi:prepilin-type N-terminal cleavage/methylation domain-containing protein
MRNNSSPLRTAGFTLIEMLVSLALYTIVVTISVGSLLVLVDGSARVQGDQSVMTTLTFAMDSMTREIRTGRSYYCDRTNIPGGGSTIFGSGDQDAILGTTSVNTCINGNNGNQDYHGISFVEGGDSISGSDFRILYYFDQSTGVEAENKLMRRVGNQAPESIVSEGIVLSRVEFFVTGTVTGAAGGDGQPTVTIIIEATESGAPTDKPFVLQTTITQRELDL